MTSQIDQLPTEHEHNEQQSSSSSEGNAQRSISTGSNIGISGDAQTKPTVRPRKTFGELLQRERVLW